MRISMLKSLNAAKSPPALDSSKTENPFRWKEKTNYVLIIWKWNTSSNHQKAIFVSDIVRERSCNFEINEYPLAVHLQLQGIVVTERLQNTISLNDWIMHVTRNNDWNIVYLPMFKGDVNNVNCRFLVRQIELNRSPGIVR